MGESTRDLLARPDGLGSFSSPSPRPSLMRSTCARPPVPILDLRALRFGRFGGPISVWVSNYVCVAT